MKNLFKTFLVLTLVTFLSSCSDDLSKSIDLNLEPEQPLVIFAPYPKVTYNSEDNTFSTELVPGPFFNLQGSVENKAIVENKTNDKYLQILAITMKGTSSKGTSVSQLYPFHFGDPGDVQSLLPGTASTIMGNTIPNDLSTVSAADFSDHLQNVVIGDPSLGIYTPLFLRPGDLKNFSVDIFSIAGDLDEGVIEDSLRGTSFSYEMILQGVFIDKDRKEEGSFSARLFFSTKE